MLNMIKMDLYRMFRTKSMYVIWIIMLVSVLLTTFLDKIDYDASVTQEEQSVQMESDDINIGMNVILPTEPQKKVSVFDVFYANTQGRFYALFLIIFAVIFSTADIKSGYIKNIGGQVPKRGMLIVSRAVSLALFTIITFVGAFLFQAAANIIVFKCIVWGNLNQIMSYFLTELVLNYAFVLICMAIAIIIKNNVISMTISVCLTMNIMSIVYGLINFVIYKMGINNFQIYNYTITGKIALLSIRPSGNEMLNALCVALVFIVVMLSLSSYVFQKRDI